MVENERASPGQAVAEEKSLTEQEPISEHLEAIVSGRLRLRTS